MRVFAYFNLHKRCFSLKALSGPEKGRVVAHASKAFITDAELHVSEAGRQRVIRDQSKNVHAGIIGKLVAFQMHSDIPGAGWRAGVEQLVCEIRDMPERDPRGWVSVTYNPYRFSSFVERESGEPVLNADAVLMMPGATYALHPSGADSVGFDPDADYFEA